MRLVACALSAVLLSGCSWLGFGGNDYYDSTGYYGHGGVNCMPLVGTASAVGHTGMYGDCGVGSAYGVSSGSTGYGATAYGHGHTGAHGYGVGSQGASGYGYKAAGSNGVGYGYNGLAGAGGTVLGAAAPYGASVAGGLSVPGTNPVGGVPGQVVSRTVYGSNGTAYSTTGYGNAYAGNGYAGYYGAGLAGVNGTYIAGGAMPFGLEASVGTEVALDGDIFPGEASKPFLGGPGTVSDLVPISYDDAFDNAVTYELAAAYDLDPTTTVFGQVGYSKAEGKTFALGTVDDGLGLTEDLSGSFSDFEQLRVEGGVRKYMNGQGYGLGALRPYVGGSAGFVKTEDVTLTQSSASLVNPAAFQQTFLRGGWNPTAAGIVGAEWQTGNRTAIGIETGIRWTDRQDTNFKSDDIWSVPVKLRGRVAF